MLSRKTKRILAQPSELRDDDVIPDLVADLENLKVFERFSNRTKELLAKKLILTSHTADDLLLRQGEREDPPQAMYIILSGLVSGQYNLPEGKAFAGGITHFPEKLLHKGDCFGYGDLLRNRPSSVDVRTVGYSEFLILRKEYIGIVRSDLDVHYTRLVQFMHSSEAVVGFDWTDEEYLALEIYVKLARNYPEDFEIYNGLAGNKPYWSYFVVSGECKIIREVSFHIKNDQTEGKIYKSVNPKSENTKNKHVQQKYLEFERGKLGYFFGVGEDFGTNRVLATRTLECLVIPRLLLAFKNKQRLSKMAEDLTVSLPSDQDILNSYSEQVQVAEKKQEMFKELFKDNPEKLVGSEKKEKPRFIKYV